MGWHAVVCKCFVPSNCVKVFHSYDSNCRPQSVVTVNEVLKREIHVCIKCLRATVSAVQSVIGTASGQRVKRSTHVRRYTQPLEGGSGPTKSICTWSKHASGVAKVARGAVEWWWISARWHHKQERAHLLISCWYPFSSQYQQPQHWWFFSSCRFPGISLGTNGISWSRPIAIWFLPPPGEGSIVLLWWCLHYVWLSTGIQRPYVPPSFCRAIFHSLHSMSHPGIRATQRLVTSRFVSPGINCWKVWAAFAEKLEEAKRCGNSSLGNILWRYRDLRICTNKVNVCEDGGSLQGSCKIL